MSRRSVLLVTARHSSLGETYTASRFARDLCRAGWKVEILAFPFAARYLEREGWSLRALTDDREQNRACLDHAVHEVGPDLIITSDYYLLRSCDVARVWSTEWLLDLDLPIASFDHLGFHPHQGSIGMQFLRRFELRALYQSAGSKAPRINGHRMTFPKGPEPESTRCPIEALPPQVSALIRPCPTHDPSPDTDPRIFKFSALEQTAASRATGPTKASVRNRFGIQSHERVVLVPIGSWAVELARALGISYYEHYPRLLAHYLGRTGRPIRLILLSGELEARQEQVGGVTIQVVPGLPWHETQSLIETADLVLCDNITSALNGRAVLAGSRAAVATSSVAAIHDGTGGIRFEAPFPLTGQARRMVEDLEHQAPGSIFPFLVYPMGWCQALAPMLEGSSYQSTFCRLELFDEAGASSALEQLLFDEPYRADLRQRQDQYTTAVRHLADAPSIAEAIVGATRSQLPWS